MGTKPTERQTPIALPPEVIRELHRAALALQPYVDRPERELTKGPMMGYVARWFLALSRDEQLRIVLAGKKIADAETPVDLAIDPAMKKVVAESRENQPPKSRLRKQ